MPSCRIRRPLASYYGTLGAFGLPGMRAIQTRVCERTAEDGRCGKPETPAGTRDRVLVGGPGTSGTNPAIIRAPLEPICADMAESDPGALLRLVAAGDPRALGDFYDRYSALVNGLALRILRNGAEAEDVVQEVFLQVWHQAQRFDAARGSVAGWLCAIARSRALDKLRRRTSRREECEDRAPASAVVPTNDEALAVRKALDSLSPEQRVALELAYYEGLSQSEIAEHLGEPLGTVKTRIRTAMMRLRAILAPVAS